MDIQPVPPPVEVSVILVTYNCLPALRRSLLALEQGKARETFEILVADNGSQDGSATIDGEFGAVTVLRMPRNFGLTKARNIASRTAKGEFVLLLEADVELEPDTLPKLVARLRADGDVAAAAPLLVDEQGNPLSTAAALPTPETLRAHWRTGQLPALPVQPAGQDAIPADYLRPGALLVRREFIRGMNYFDERYAQHWGEAELCVRARRAGKRILILPAARALWRRGEGMWKPETPAARAALSADSGLGAAAFVGKHHGWKAGLRFQLELPFRALGGLLMEPSDLAYHFGCLAAIVQRRKINGFQTGV